MEGVVLLVDGDGDAVGGVGHLADGVDDETIVPDAVVGGDHVQAVADVEQGRQVVLVGGGILLGQILLAQLVGQGIHLLGRGLIQGGEDVDGGLRKGQVLALLQHLAHDLGGQRRPGAVLHQGHGAVAEVPLGQVVDELLHEGEHIGVIGGGGQNQLAVAEGIRHGLGHVAPGQIVDDHLGAAVGAELVRQLLHRGLGIAIDAGIGDDHALGLHGIAGPQVIQPDIVTQVFLQHGAVEGADGLDVQRGRLFQQCLDLGAVLTHDADIVPAGFTGPVLLHIQGTELAEAVGGEQDLVQYIIGHNDLGPVNHGGRHKGQGVLAQAQGISLPHYDPAILIAGAEEGPHHIEGLG